jgi:hypothetical protein
MEATKCLKPSDSGSRNGDRASVQAATRVSAPGDRQGVCGERRAIGGRGSGPATIWTIPAPKPRHGRRDCCLENGSGSVGEPKVRIHLPPAASQQRTVRLAGRHHHSAATTNYLLLDNIPT